MSLPTSIGAYREELDVFTRAIESPSGIRVPVADFGAATHFRMRLHQARTIDRRKNAQTYLPDHPLHNTSIYDPLVVTIVQDAGIVYLYIKRSSYVMGQIEDLGVIEGEVVDESEAIEDQRHLLVSTAEEIEDDFAPASPRRRF